MSAKDRLISILNGKIIHASIMPWTYANAVCFTECPWSSLISHTNNYSPYGIGFNKSFVYSRHGGPVFYIRPDHFKKQIKNSSFDKHVYPFITPFSPTYRPKHIMQDATLFKDVNHLNDKGARMFTEEVICKILTNE